MIKKILFVGLGSAGQRHLRNLLAILGEGTEIIAYRYHKSERVFDCNMQVVENMVLSEKYKIREFDDYEEALDERPDIVIIANPNNMHVPYAIKAAERGLDVFIEKPLSISYDGIDHLMKVIVGKNIINQVGFQYRYHPCLKLAKKYLMENRLGKIVSANAEVGERISRMHSYEDYRNMAETHKSLGGGVVLCQIHELDYISWLFGEPDSVFGVGGKQGDFDMDVEDSATALLHYKKVGSEFAVVLHQDFLQYPPVRKCEIRGTEARLQIDLLKHRFSYQNYESEMLEEKEFTNFNRNDMFIVEMQEFLKCVEKREMPECDIKAAMGSMRIGLAIKESFQNGKEVML